MDQLGGGGRDAWLLSPQSLLLVPLPFRKTRYSASFRFSIDPVFLLRSMSFRGVIIDWLWRLSTIFFTQVVLGDLIVEN